MGRRTSDAVLGWLAEHVGPMLVRSLGVTLRTRRQGFENVTKAKQIAGSVIYAFWHGRLLALSYLHRNEGINVLVSMHSDGEYITRVIHRLGFSTSRGSTTRGGRSAVVDMLRAGSRRVDVGITPDGPRGPRGRCQPGVIYLAKRSQLPIIPIGLCYWPSITLGSWDRFMIPLPFAKGVVIYGEPVVYDASVLREAIVEAQEDLEKRLWAVTQAADYACGRRPE